MVHEIAHRMGAKEDEMKLKLDANGNVVLQDGKPVYVKDDGTEIAFDAAGTVQTISRLNGEAKGHRERAEAAEGKLKLFEGIEDPKQALEALNTVKNLDAKKLVDAGEIEKVRTEISKAFQTQLDAANGKVAAFEKELYKEKVGGAFARSPLIVGDKATLAIPPDLVEAKFGSNFAIEDGKIVAKDAHGNKIYSQTNPGELAGFDEALSILVNNYQHKDQILKSTGASGSGGKPGSGNGSPSTKKSSEMSPQEKAAYISEHGITKWQDKVAADLSAPKA